MMDYNKGSLSIEALVSTVGFFVLSSGSISSCANINIPIIETRSIIEESGTPKLITECDLFGSKNIVIEGPVTKDKKPLVYEALELFEGIRGFNKKEARQYKNHLLKISRPTGKNFFDKP